MMNSTGELNAYRETSKTSPNPPRNQPYFEYDFTDDKPAKKDKKWSLGKLFRRKKKSNDSSSDEDFKKLSTDKKNRKTERRKKPISFDHVVITQPQIITAENSNNQNRVENVLSDCSPGNRRNNKVYFDSSPKIQSNLYYGDPLCRNHPNQLSLDSISRKSRKDLTKVRAEARRTSFNHHSSSDEDSQRSNSSHRLRSDESLSKMRDSSAHKRSRAARTERYLKRHSKDGESSSNYLRVSKSDAESSFLKLSDDGTGSHSESPSQLKLSYSGVSSQSPSVLGLSTIPPSHIAYNRFKVSNSTSNPSYRSPLSMNEYNNTAKNNIPQYGNLNNQRSISFDANIHKPNRDPNVIHAKLELGKPRSRNLTLVDGSQIADYSNIHQPPAPPPRDLRRVPQYLDNVNQNSQENPHSQVASNISRSNYGFSNRRTNFINSTFKSSSEDHIPQEGQIYLVKRPSSTTPESEHLWNRNKIDIKSRSDNYQYLTDKQPRSRKPIFIQNGDNKAITQRPIRNDHRLAGDSNENSAFLSQLKSKKSNRSSPQIFTCETKVKTQIFLPSVLPNNNIETEISNSENFSKKTDENNLDIVNQNIEVEEKKERKSTNLEEALNELEAIYNSLKLGDEDLLDMAEKREKEEQSRKIMESNQYYPPWNSPRGTLSDSGFCYEPFDSIDASRRKRYIRKTGRSDDMAFRKINREDRAATINNPQSVTSKISYLLASPIYANSQRLEQKTNPNEPDITYDDVVYRNIKQSNKMKVPEHPPPFGIPLGPITLAANSDYLHAVPDKDVIKRSRIPDIVKDDLAYRNLRKDRTKEPALPPVSTDDLKNNNLNNILNAIDPTRYNSAEIKKNRALRSKSANIGSLISQEVIERASRRNARDKNTEEYKTFADIADAMQIARQVLKEKEQKITENKRASMSDTDTGNLKYTRYPVKFSYTRDKSPNSVRRGENSDFVKPYPKDIEDDSFKIKEDTPDPVSAFEDSRLRPLFRTKSFEDALAALAVEAKEASDKFTKDLGVFDDKKQNVEERVNSPPVDLCKKLRDAVVVSAQHIAINKDDKERENVEDSAKILDSVESIVQDMTSQQMDETDHDYENIDVDINEDKSGKKSPFEQYKDQLISAFKDLNIDDNIESKGVQSETVCDLRDGQHQGEFCDKPLGEPYVDVVESIAFESISECAFNPTNVSNILPEDSNSICDSDDESSGFHSQTSFPDNLSLPPNENSFQRVHGSKLELSESLKSPKLVLETSKLGKMSSNLLETPRNRVGMDRNCSEKRHIPDNFKSSGAWHNNPATLAIACSYGIACFHQLASLDLFAVMGIIFAIFTFIAALLI